MSFLSPELTMLQKLSFVYADHGVFIGLNSGSFWSEKAGEYWRKP